MHIVRALAVTMLGACWWGAAPPPPASPSEPTSPSAAQSPPSGRPPSSPPGTARATGRTERLAYRSRHIQHTDNAVTSVLEIDGERATLTAEGQIDWRDGRGWQTKGGEVLRGTLRGTAGALLLDVASDQGTHWKMTCTRRTERVAVATAIRIPDP